MNKTVRIKDLTFSLFLSAEEIRHQVVRVAHEISDDLEGENPLFVVMLNGAFLFAADLLREIQMPCEVRFVRFSSYEGTHSTGTVHEIMGLDTNVEGRTVVIVEDIVDTGLTMKRMTEMLKEKKPRDIRIASLLLKPGSLREDVQVPYRCFEIPNDFVVGYGLDYDQIGRNLPAIYVAEGKNEKK